MVTPQERAQVFEGFPPQSRIWIFQSPQPFSDTDKRKTLEILHGFLPQWKAHQQPVTGAAKLLFDHFLVVLADESVTAVSGCSGDSLHQMVRSIASETQLDLFNRVAVPVLRDEVISFWSRKELTSAVRDGRLPEDLTIFNQTVASLGEWIQYWLIPFNQSWLQRSRPASSTPAG